ncbi:hypothetical protein L9F63_016155, partial [Diploptera punctata]
LNRLRLNGVLHKHRMTNQVRAFSKEKSVWSRVGVKEVAPIMCLLLAGITASVMVLLLEKITLKLLINLQIGSGTFFCIPHDKNSKLL